MPCGCGAGLIDPITEYDHNQGQSITGGYVYRGNAIPELQGFYVFGDFVSGRIWVIPATSPQGTLPQEILDTAFGISSFAANAASPCPQGVGGGDCPEIYAHGLRNPWRWSFDRMNDDLWVGDVGQGQWEEVDRVVAGGNYGWRCREGAHDFNTTGCGAGLIDPITEYDHTQGQSITGGYVYGGNEIPELQGFYIFGDFVSGRIWVIPAMSPQGTLPQEILNTAFGISSFAEDNDGELYVIDYAGGVHRIVDVP